MTSADSYDLLIDVMVELMKFTLLLRDRQDYLVGRYCDETIKVFTVPPIFRGL